MLCPYQHCSALLPGTVAGACPFCHGALVMCPRAIPPCQTFNRRYASYCRECGHPLPVPTPLWPQAGGNAARAGAGDGAGNLRAGSIGPRTCGSREHATCVPLEPVIASDRSVVLLRSDGAPDRFAAFCLDAGRLLWSCNTFCSGLTSLSTPVCVGAFAYFVTSTPNRLHRIDLSTGEREIVAPLIDDEPETALPGTLIPDASPLLIAPHGIGNAGAPDDDTGICLLLSHQGLLFVELEPSHRRDGVAMAKVRTVPCNLSEGSWSAPVLLGRSVVATNRGPCRTLRAELEYYPNRIPVAVQSWPEYRVFSPCMAQAAIWTRNMFAWTASDNQGNLHLAQLFSEGDWRMDALGMTGTPARPVMGSDTLYVPGLAAGARREGLLASKTGLEATVVRQELPAPIAPERMVCIDRHTNRFFVAQPQRPFQFVPGGGGNVNHLTPYEPSGMTVPTAPPSVGADKVLVATDHALCIYG